jgi:hypothetical protein
VPPDMGYVPLPKCTHVQGEKQGNPNVSSCRSAFATVPWSALVVACLVDQRAPSSGAEEIF